MQSTLFRRPISLARPLTRPFEEKAMRATATSIHRPTPSLAASAAARRPVQPPSRRSWLDRWFGRREPTVYERCLAIHIHYAGPRSALS
jgi:hypothetical protein